MRMAVTLGGPPLGGSDPVVSPRPVVRALPAYKPGRNPADLAREIGVDRAIKLASNEVAFPPLPAVVEAGAPAPGGTHPHPPKRAPVPTRGPGGPPRARPPPGGTRRGGGPHCPG